MKIKIDVDTLSTAQAAAWDNSIDRVVKTYNLGYALVKTDLEIMDEIHGFENLPMMLEALDVPDDLMSKLHRAMVKIVAEVPSAHKSLIEAARELVRVLCEKIKLIHKLLGLTRSELGRESTAADHEFEKKYRKLVASMA